MSRDHNFKKRFEEFITRSGNSRQEHKLKHEEFKKEHEEFHRQQDEYRKKFLEMHGNAEFHRFRMHARIWPIFILIFNIVVWFLLFKYIGVKTISIFLALLACAIGLLEFLFLRKIETKILSPIDKLKKGVEEIGNGNYGVKVECNINNEIGILIDAFNEMAQKLQNSEKLKTEYEENRKNLIANISHDLKTPITSIQGYIEAILEGNAGSLENTNKYLKIIYNNSGYINKLIDDLFLFSKLDIQKLEFQFQKVQIRSFIKDLMEEFKLELEDRQIQFHFSDYMKGDNYISIDSKRLYQIFRNVIGNAVKYGPTQGLVITSELHSKDTFIVINIKDNGPGISEDKLPHVFDRFYRIDSERTKDFMSTGLGLAIAKELVEAHGGEIFVESADNAGCCFSITLPIVSL